MILKDMGRKVMIWDDAAFDKERTDTMRSKVNVTEGVRNIETQLGEETRSRWKVNVHKVDTTIKIQLHYSCSA